MSLRSLLAGLVLAMAACQGLVEDGHVTALSAPPDMGPIITFSPPVVILPSFGSGTTTMSVEGGPCDSTGITVDGDPNHVVKAQVAQKKLPDNGQTTVTLTGLAFGPVWGSVALTAACPGYSSTKSVGYCIDTINQCPTGACGLVNKGCDDIIDCGGCPTGEICNGNKCWLPVGPN